MTSWGNPAHRPVGGGVGAAGLKSWARVFGWRTFRHGPRQHQPHAQGLKSSSRTLRKTAWTLRPSTTPKSLDLGYLLIERTGRDKDRLVDSQRSFTGAPLPLGGRML